VVENNDSVTGVIQSAQHKFTTRASPPQIGADNWLDYVLKWNDFVCENMPAFLHDTYLRTLVGCDLDTILRSEFLGNYVIVDYLDRKYVDMITELYTHVKQVCGELYDLGL
jgi:hypothetical protein